MRQSLNGATRISWSIKPMRLPGVSLLTVLFLVSCCFVSAQTMKRGEYFFDSDPGKGNGTSLSFTQAASINQSFNINISSLSQGTHTFNIRFLDSNGHWSLFDSRTFFITTPAAVSNATSLKRVEYFFDNDPGTGLATKITITPGSPQNNSFAISLSSLTSGFHQLAIRYQDNLGHWSLFSNRTFYIVPAASGVASTTLKKVEYFFDNDPGTGGGKSLPISAASTENNVFAIDISSLTSGFHQLAIRYQDNALKWSTFANRTFYIVPSPNVAPSTNLKRAEYFFDSDPGLGLGSPLSITPGGTQNNLFAIDISSLTPGFHQLCIRYQDNKTKWSQFTNRTFYIVPPANALSGTSLTKAEYFFDHDPGTGSGTPISISPTTPENNNFAIDISSLSPGFHQVGIRYQDNFHRWSTFSTRTFYVIPGVVVTKTLQRLEYFVDTDPGYGSAQALTFTPASTLSQQFAIDLSGVPPGSHSLNLRIKDSQGYWSTITTSTFTIQSCIPPSAPAGVNGSRCDAGSVTLSATGATGTQQYHWYADNTTSTVLFTGPSYSTTSLTVNTDYYVSVYDPVTTCESNRTKVTASVSGIAKPTISPNGSLTLCAGNTITLTAPPGFVSYAWSNGATTQQITVSSSASYSVTVGDGTCTSLASDPLVLTIVPNPVKPIVQVTGNTTICGSGSVMLSAPAGASGYAWSDGSSTQQITVSAAGDFSVQVSDANNCQSPTSDQTSVQVVAVPPKPTITPLGSTTSCTNSPVTLSAPLGFSSYNWSNGATSQQIAASASGSYTVTVGSQGCSSISSDPTPVTITSGPTKPVIQVTGNTAICGSGSVTLAAPAGALGYLWSDGSTAQQLIASAAGNYSVQIIDANNCQSPLSDQTAVQVVPIPAKPNITSVGSTTSCTNSPVLLSAPVGFTSYRWSNGATTQQIATTASGSYTVTVGTQGCNSVVSDPTSVTITSGPAKPVVQVIGNTTICGSGSVTLSGPSGAASYLWSDGEATQQISVTTVGKFSVKITDTNNCQSISSDSTSVQVTTPPAKPKITIIGSTTLCSNASVVLVAPPGYANYVWSNGMSTQQIILTGAGSYSVMVGNTANCMSPSSDAVDISLSSGPCISGGNPVNTPPSISDTTIDVPVGTKVVVELTARIKKGSAGIDFSTLHITQSPASGARAYIDASNNLVLDYTGNSFAGKESVGVQVCDSLNSCTEHTFPVNVVASVEVYNAVSPYPDGINDFFNLKYIDKIAETISNKVVIVDRWGNEVFSISDYNNTDRVFKGVDNSGRDLPSGTYYFRVDFPSGVPTLTGFISLKR